MPISGHAQYPLPTNSGSMLKVVTLTCAEWNNMLLAQLFFTKYPYLQIFPIAISLFISFFCVKISYFVKVYVNIHIGPPIKSWGTLAKYQGRYCKHQASSFYSSKSHLGSVKLEKWLAVNPVHVTNVDQARCEVLGVITGKETRHFSLSARIISILTIPLLRNELILSRENIFQ